MTTTRISAKSALQAYNSLPQPVKQSPTTVRRNELTRILAARRPSATPNITHRVAVANRYIRIYGVTA